jgi:hypothetical protein
VKVSTPSDAKPLAEAPAPANSPKN